MRWYVWEHQVHQIRGWGENVQAHEQLLALRPNPIKDWWGWFTAVYQRGIDWDFWLYDRRALILVYHCVLLLRAVRDVLWRVRILLQRKKRYKLQLSWRWEVTCWGQGSYLVIIWTTVDYQVYEMNRPIRDSIRGVYFLFLLHSSP